MLKVNLSVAIIAMTDNSSNLDFEYYDWSTETRGIIFSSFFWGYTISPFVFGIIIQRFGIKIPVLVSTSLCALLNIFTPAIISNGWQYLCVSRIIQGLLQGVFLPSIQAFIAKWIHPSEKCRLGAVIFTGGEAGTVIMMSISGTIITSSIGWPGIFYISGAVMGLWSCFWFFFGYNSPGEHPTISILERNFIESIPGNHRELKYVIPWKQLFTSIPFISLTIANIVSAWIFWMLITQIPSYINGVMHFNINSNALFSALPYASLLILIVIFGQISDFVINKHYLSIEIARKTFNTIGLWLPGICLITLGFNSRDNVVVALILLTLSVSMLAGIYVGLFMNFVDLSPNFAGPMMGVSLAFSNIVALFAPITVGYVVTDMTDPTQWRIIFLLTSGLVFVGNLIFLIFGRTTLQKWNDYGNR